MEPVLWRLARAAAASAIVGFLALATIALLESAANPPGSTREWHLEKAEYVSWWIATCAFPWFALTRLPPSPWWGFLRAASPVAILWVVYDQGAKVSASLHHAEPAWLEWVTFAAIYVGLVPWSSWRRLIKTGPPTSAATKT